MSSVNEALPQPAISLGTLVATVAANALTVAMKTPSGADPSPADPLFTSFPTSVGGDRSRALP